MNKPKLTKWLLILSACIVLTTAAAITLSHYYMTPIIMYHHIDDRAQQWKLSVSPTSFEKQMRYFKDHHYYVMSLEDYINHLKKGDAVPRKSVIITFDDGYKNNYTNALPILKKYNFPATFFIQVDGIGRDDYMTREQVQDLLDNGFTIGSHTVHHGFLPNLNTDEKIAEITTSKALLENMLGVDINLFSYPGGGFDSESRDITIAAGYTGAVATHPGPNYPNKDPYALKRIRIARTADNFFTFIIQISGFYTYIEEFRG